MSPKCWIDLFDLPEFQGGRRRYFGPARLDAEILGLRNADGVSVRVGTEAALCIELSGGGATTLHGGQTLHTLDTTQIRMLDVRPEQQSC